ncbi:MAG: hypothetical protein ACLR60_08595 [Clostridium paraputrificum]
MSKLEKVLKICADIECDLDRGYIRRAESKLMNLCGVLAKGTKYEDDIDRLGELYLKKF